MERLPFPPLYPYYPFHPAAAAAAAAAVATQHPVHPMILFHHHMAALNYTAASLPESSFRSSKNGSIADLRLKARQHLASLGMWCTCYFDQTTEHVHSNNGTKLTDLWWFPVWRVPRVRCFFLLKTQRCQRFLLLTHGVGQNAALRASPAAFLILPSPFVYNLIFYQSS